MLSTIPARAAAFKRKRFAAALLVTHDTHAAFYVVPGPQQVETPEALKEVQAALDQVGACSSQGLRNCCCCCFVAVSLLIARCMASVASLCTSPA